MSISINNHEQRISDLEKINHKTNLVWTSVEKNPIISNNTTVTLPSSAVEFMVIGFDNWDKLDNLSMNQSMIIPVDFDVSKAWEPYDSLLPRWKYSKSNRTITVTNRIDNNGVYIFYR